MAYISQVKLPSGSTYDIKDASAWSKINDIYSIINQGSLEIVAVDTLPAASADTKGKLYLVRRDGTGSDIHDEYVTIDGTPSGYVWEKIGTTDIDLSTYAPLLHHHDVSINIGVNDHSYTPTGSVSAPTFTGTASTISISGVPSGTIQAPSFTGTGVRLITGDIPVPSTYTFTGTESTITLNSTDIDASACSVTIDATLGHTHNVTRTTRYLHPVSVPSEFTTAEVLADVSSNKLVTTSIKGVAGTGTVHDTPSLTKTNVGSASGWNAGTASSWSFSVANGSETLVIEGSNSTAPSLSIADVSVGTDIVEGATKTFATAANSSTTVATGAISSDGAGANVVTAPGNTVSCYVGIAETVNSFISDTVSTGGTAYISSVTQKTSTAGAHNHSGSININDLSIESEGLYTPIGTVSTASTVNKTATVSAAASGAVTFTPAGTISAPIFNGSTFDASVSYTPAGTISKPTFTGTAATISHTVTGNGRLSTTSSIPE